jgi:hypothetical protein
MRGSASLRQRVNPSLEVSMRVREKTGALVLGGSDCGIVNFYFLFVTAKTAMVPRPGAPLSLHTPVRS